MSRVTKTLKRTDDWLPCLFPPGFEGKRIAGTGRGVGVAYKANYFEITTSFAKDKMERFTIVAWNNGAWEDLEDTPDGDDGTLATEVTSFSTRTADNYLGTTNYDGGYLKIRRENRTHTLGTFELFWFPIPDGKRDDPRKTKKTQVILVYPTPVNKYGLFGRLGGGRFTQAYQHRVDSMDDLQQMLSTWPSQWCQ